MTETSASSTLRSGRLKSLKTLLWSFVLLKGARLRVCALTCLHCLRLSTLTLYIRDTEKLLAGILRKPIWKDSRHFSLSHRKSTLRVWVALGMLQTKHSEKATLQMVNTILPISAFPSLSSSNKAQLYNLTLPMPGCPIRWIEISEGFLKKLWGFYPKKQVTLDMPM